MAVSVTTTPASPRGASMRVVADLLTDMISSLDLIRLSMLD